MNDATVTYPAIDRTAPCISVNPELFFPSKETNTAQIAKAKAVCNSGAAGAPCPFRNECLAYGLHHRVEGVWGGASAAEREAMRRRSGIKPAPLSFGVGATNTTIARRMVTAGSTVAEIAMHLMLSQEAVRRTLRATA